MVNKKNVIGFNPKQAKSKIKYERYNEIKVFKIN